MSFYFFCSFKPAVKLTVLSTEREFRGVSDSQLKHLILMFAWHHFTAGCSTGHPKGTAGNQRAGIKHWYHLHHTLISTTMARINSRKSYFRFFSYLPRSNLLTSSPVSAKGGREWMSFKVHSDPLTFYDSAF